VFDCVFPSRSSCSTPYGNQRKITSRCSPVFCWQGRVLNALRQSEENHHRITSAAIVPKQVLNALRQSEENHGVCAGDPRPTLVGAQRLTAIRGKSPAYSATSAPRLYVLNALRQSEENHAQFTKEELEGDIVLNALRQSEENHVSLRVSEMEQFVRAQRLTAIRGKSRKFLSKTPFVSTVLNALRQSEENHVMKNRDTR